jgi:hypothetical protein
MNNPAKIFLMYVLTSIGFALVAIGLYHMVIVSPDRWGYTFTGGVILAAQWCVYLVEENISRNSTKTSCENCDRKSLENK